MCCILEGRLVRLGFNKEDATGVLTITRWTGGVVNVPSSVNAVHLWCPNVAASAGGCVSPDNLKLCRLQLVDGSSPCYLDVAPCSSGEVVAVEGLLESRNKNSVQRETY